MKKTYIITTLTADTFDTKEDAIKAAKLKVVSPENKQQKDYYILETIAVARVPTPTVEIEEIK